MLANIEAGETFIVWDNDQAPAGTITINRFAKPELRTEEERAEPALSAYKVTVDRGTAAKDLAPSCWIEPGPRRPTRAPTGCGGRVDDQRAPPALLPQAGLHLRPHGLPHNPSGALFSGPPSRSQLRDSERSSA